MTRLCANLIVRNESKIIERCLRSLAPRISCYSILDTGSTDGTPDIIRNFMEVMKIPGRVNSIPFVNFEQARNAALDDARNLKIPYDYILLADADFEFVVDDPNFRDKLTGPAYKIANQHANGSLAYSVIRLVRHDVPAKYIGVTHEYLDIGAAQAEFLPGISYLDHADGGSRGDKYERDIRLLTKGLEDNPRNSRYVFYLANSYYDCSEWATAIDWYAKRLVMGGWEEERFYSQYRIALCYQKLSQEAKFIHAAMESYNMMPSRAEPLHAIASHYLYARKYKLAYMFATWGNYVFQPKDALFVEPDVYRWRLSDIMAVAEYWLGNKNTSRRICESILPLVPASERARVEKNLEFCGVTP